MIDFDSVKKRIRFTVEHFGTNTQGEAYRFEQVADELTELFIQLTSANSAIEEALKDYDRTSFIIKISV